ncbi:MAG TPA: PilZ domain-containing protein [Candidatus Acidoferrum sp.]|nr:PilZ domain-containing protein [Candidatus Acidoferrum sp.]
MKATNRIALPEVQKDAAAPQQVEPASLPQPFPPPVPVRIRTLSLRVVPLRTESAIAIRRFARVPTHAVGVFHEQREYPRASLKLPLRLRSVEHVAEKSPITLVTRDISSTGVFFLCPKPLALNVSIELEIVLVSRPMGRGNVVAVTVARVRRVEAANMPGWFGIAASFDDLKFDRDDSVLPSSHPA